MRLPFRAKWRTSGCVSSSARNYYSSLTRSHPQIYIDRKSQTVVFPIHGYAVPFHINTIKNVSKSEEAEFTTLRVNFQTPGQLAGRKEDTVSTTKCYGFRPWPVTDASLLAFRRPGRDVHPVNHVPVY